MCCLKQTTLKSYVNKRALRATEEVSVGIKVPIVKAVEGVMLVKS
jgi:hypothetical protein